MSDDEEESSADEQALIDAGAKLCESLRISYRDPLAKDKISEDVFLDPRDVWRADGFNEVAAKPGGAAAGSNLLLVGASSVTALQQQQDREACYISSAQAVTDACRRDYMREQARLLQELALLKHHVPKNVIPDIQALQESASEWTQKAMEGGAEAILHPDEVETMALAMGPMGPDGQPMDPDPDAERILLESGFAEADLCTKMVLIKRLLMSTGSDMAERERMRLLLAGMEGTSNSKDGLFNAMMAAADGSGTEIIEIFQALLEVAPNEDDRKKIEDRLTNGVKGIYEKQKKRFEEMDPKVKEWREIQRKQSERNKRANAVTQEESEVEEQLAEKLAKEKDMVDDWEKRRLERWERRKKKKEEKEAKKQILKDDPCAFVDIQKHLSEADKDWLRKEERAQGAYLRRAEQYEEKTATFESEIEAAEESMVELKSRKKAAQDFSTNLAKEIERNEAKVRDAELVFEEATVELKDLKSVLDDVKDEYKAATMPPPKEKDYGFLEREIEQQALKNEELRNEETRLWDRVELYEHRWERTENAYLAKKEEEAAAEFYAKLADEEAQARAAALRVPKVVRRVSDPLLLDYRQRLALPEYSNLQRHLNLFTDYKARDRQQQKRDQEVAEARRHHQARCAASDTPAVASNAVTGTKEVPLTFRRQEDLRLRVELAERNLECHTAELSGQGGKLREMFEELQSLGRHVGTHAAEAARLHSEVSERFDAAIQATEVADCDARAELSTALEQHRAAVSKTEDAWRFAELACQRGASEADLGSEGEACASCEERLTQASRSLYNVAEHVARTGPEVLVAASKQCTADWDASEPKLVAARAAYGNAWPHALRTAAGLQRERAAQDGLQTLLRSEERRRHLLDREIHAPPEAKRALAAMRAATTVERPAGGQQAANSALAAMRAATTGERTGAPVLRGSGAAPPPADSALGSAGPPPGWTHAAGPAPAAR